MAASCCFAGNRYRLPVFFAGASLQLPEVIHGLLRFDGGLRFDCCWNTTKVDSIFFVGLEFSLAFVILGGDVPDCFPEMALSQTLTHTRAALPVRW